MSRKNLNEDYYLGLDIGTDSVGWAVTDSKPELFMRLGFSQTHESIL